MPLAGSNPLDCGIGFLIFSRMIYVSGCATFVCGGLTQLWW